MGDMTIIGSVSVEQYNEGVRATAILGAICDMLRSDVAYASADIMAILGIEKKEKPDEGNGRDAGSQDTAATANN